MEKVKKRLFSDGREYIPGELEDFSLAKNRDKLLSVGYIIPYSGKTFHCKDCGKKFDKITYDSHVKAFHIKENERDITA